MKLQTIILAAGILSFAACHNHEHDETDVTAPEIRIDAPAADASLTGAISIKGLVTDEGLHEISITITNESTSAELFKASPKAHAEKSVTLNETWTPSGLSAETPVVLTVTAEDHSGNKDTKTVRFKAD